MGNLRPTTIWEPLRLWKPARCPFDVKFHGGARGWQSFLLILKQKKVMEMSWHPRASLAKPLQKRVLKFESTNCIGSFCNHFCWPLIAQSNNTIQSQNIGKRVAQLDFDLHISILHVFLTIKNGAFTVFHACYGAETSRVTTLNSK